jgi:murein DD-endopeptidase MepM/ murein hydrolase activator NlpD
VRPVSVATVALISVVAAATAAGASKHRRRDVTPPPAVDVARVALGDQVAAESLAAAQAATIVHDKLAALDAMRVRRLAAATPLLGEPLPATADAGERLDYARRRAALRLLVQRDRDERALLADELAKLQQAQGSVASEAKQVAAVELPPGLLRPADGTVARPFGAFVHEATHATLSRRGVDFEVEDHVPVVAPADGVVRYAGVLRGLDHGVVLDHGAFLTVIGKLADNLPPVGTHVKRGEHLGKAAHRRVYLEVRLKLGPGGLPIDPESAFAR